MDRKKLKFISESEEFRTSEHFLLYITLRKSRLVLYTHRSNYSALCKAIEHFHANVDSSQFWDNASPHLRWNTQKKITTHVFNYLNSASAIADISRINSQRHLQSQDQELLKKHIADKFVDTPSLRFIRDLRNYIAHYSLLDIGVNLNWHYKNGKTPMIYLSKNRLLEWSGWKGKAKEFVKVSEEMLNIEPLLDNYHAEFMSTQDLLFKKMISQNVEQLYALVGAMKKILEKAIELKMLDSIPFRRSTLRYLICLLKVVSEET